MFTYAAYIPDPFKNFVMKVCWVLTKPFSAFNQIIMWYFHPFQFVYMVDELHWQIFRFSLNPLSLDKVYFITVSGFLVGSLVQFVSIRKCFLRWKISMYSIGENGDSESQILCQIKINYLSYEIKFNVSCSYSINILCHEGFEEILKVVNKF